MIQPFSINDAYFTQKAKPFLQPLSEIVDRLKGVETEVDVLKSFPANFEADQQKKVEKGVEKTQAVFTDVKIKRIVTAAIGIGVGLGVSVCIILGAGTLGITLGVVGLVAGVAIGYFVGLWAARDEGIKAALPSFQKKTIIYIKNQIIELKKASAVPVGEKERFDTFVNDLDGWVKAQKKGVKKKP